MLASSPYNVLLTDHVEAYECMKMRLLNASHTGMCYIGYLMGYTYIHEIMLNENIGLYLEHLMNDEVTPTLPPVPGIDLDTYKRTLIERFSNAHIKDTAMRVCMDGASKLPKFLVPTIVQQLKRGVVPHFCVLAVGAWIRYLGGVDEHDKPITVQDALAVELKLGALAAEIKPRARDILSVRQVFGDLVENQEFVDAVERVVQLLYETGSRATLQRWIDDAQRST